MTTQPEFIQPRTLAVKGSELFATITRLESEGAMLTALSRGPGNADWIVNIAWPSAPAQVPESIVNLSLDLGDTVTPWQGRPAVGHSKANP